MLLLVISGPVTSLTGKFMKCHSFMDSKPKDLTSSGQQALSTKLVTLLCEKEFRIFVSFSAKEKLSLSNLLYHEIKFSPSSNIFNSATLATNICPVSHQHWLKLTKIPNKMTSPNKKE